MRDWMNNYFRSVPPTMDWSKTTDAIRQVIMQDLPNMKRRVKAWKDGQKHFFELYRFDFVFDNQLNPFLMEANMSPNLSPSAHPPLRTMFRNILRDLGTLTGISLGRKRSSVEIDADYERDNAGSWILLD